MSENTQLVLVCGKSSTGKSAALRNLKSPEGVMYLNTEAGKRLPFPAKFLKDNRGNVGHKVTDPLQVFEAFRYAETLPNVHTNVVDSLTFLLQMYVSKYVNNADDGRKAWGDFAEYFRTLMQDHVAPSTKRVIFTAHTLDEVNEQERVRETKVPVQGSLKNMGIESYFSTVIATKKVTIDDLANYSNDLLVITPQDEAVGYKHVFQTQITKDTVNERIRGPMGLWTPAETYIDNDIQLVMDRLQEYYA